MKLTLQVRKTKSWENAIKSIKIAFFSEDCLEGGEAGPFYGFVAEVTVIANQTCVLDEDSENRCLIFDGVEEFEESESESGLRGREFSAGRTVCEISGRIENVSQNDTLII